MAQQKESMTQQPSPPSANSGMPGERGPQQPAAAAVQLGINPLTWSNDDMPTLGADTPLEVCLTEGRLAGFSGFELGNKFPRLAQVLGPILRAHQLQLISGWYSGRLLTRSVAEEIDVLQPHLTLLRELGAKVLIFCEVTDAIHGNYAMPLALRPQFPAARWQEYGEKLSEFARYTARQGVHVTYHHHMGTVIESAADIDHLMQCTGPEVGLLLDTGHLTFAQADPVAVTQRWAHRINHVHCKDVRSAVLAEAKNCQSSFLAAVLDGVYTVPGEGCINYAAILAILKAQGYTGWLVVEAEQDPAVAAPQVYARTGYQNLRKLAATAGLL